jgi:hypothetical protein
MSEQTSNNQQFILYTSDTGEVKLSVFLEDETIWLTQKMMAELFRVDVRTVSDHLRNIYATDELNPQQTFRKSRIVQTEGGKEVERELNFYNLDVIIAVGYRVNSKRATQFRIWATKVLREFIIKGFVLDDERLKQGERAFGKDYFKELLERVRSIRASERRIYQQITDIFAEVTTDYDPKSEISQNFYAMVQNKFHYAITGQTAAEIIHSSADRAKANMGLSAWKNSPAGRILSSDVTVAKNYLTEAQIKRLERTVTGFFDYLENILENHTALTMTDMAASVDKFLSFNEYKILEGNGRITASRARTKALKEYEAFNKVQPIESDFDREVDKMLRRKSD